MAGGPHAEIAPCWWCAGPADRVSEGVTGPEAAADDHYRCGACGYEFDLCFDRSVPTAPLWPMTADEAGRVARLSAALHADRARNPRMSGPLLDPNPYRRPFPRGPRLVWENVPDRPQFALGDVETIGAHPHCSIQILDRAIGRTGAALRRRADGRFVVRDAGSLCGTFVNGQRLEGERELTAGDEITLARCRLRFVED